MAGRGNPFPRNYSTSDSFESGLFPNPNPEENREHLFSVNNEVVNDLRRHTRAYVKCIEFVYNLLMLLQLTDDAIYPNSVLILMNDDEAY